MHDARYENVHHGGSVRDCALLTAICIDEHDKRAVLGTRVSLSEAEVHWRECLTSLHDRGLHGIKLTNSDVHKGLHAALALGRENLNPPNLADDLLCRVLLHVCLLTLRPAGFHSRRTRTREARHDHKLATFARDWRDKAPDLANWAEENIPEGLAVFALGLTEAQRKRLRATNSLENVNQQIKRQTAAVRPFPNEASLLRLASAVLMEISEEGETGRRYPPRDDA